MRGAIRLPRAGAQGRPRPGGFTLVELLVVIAIVALLMALLIPSLQRGRELGYRAVCESNLNKLWTSFHAASRLTMPSPGGWVSFVQGTGCGDVLACPKAAPGGEGGGIAGMTGGFKRIEPPASEVFDTLESNTNIFLWLEQPGITLPADVKMNISAPGRYQNTSEWTPKTLPRGTVVDCYLTHFDPVGSGPAETNGAVSFCGTILGLICLEGDLLASDPVFARPETQYDPGHWGARGFESGQEIITLSRDMQTWTVDYYYSTFPGEDVRVLTTPGGAASYGMNNQVPPTRSRPQQVLLVEYGKTVVDIDGVGCDDDFPNLLAPRHLGKANTLFLDGSVRGLLPADLDPQQEFWKP